MTPKEKIAKISQRILNDSAINPDPKWVKFNFNYNIAGAGILSEDEERRILFKLEKEKTIELHLSQFKDKEPKEVTVISSEWVRKFSSNPYYWIKILDFKKLRFYTLYLKVKKLQNESDDKRKGNFIGAKNIKNDGLIVSDTFNQIITNNYEGTGSIKAESVKDSKGKKILAIIGIISGIVTIIWFIFEVWKYFQNG